MPKRAQRDLAALLVRKASGDEVALQVLAADGAVPDEIVGFHAQQAVEKLLKAALAALDRDFPRTHDLTTLTQLLEDAGHSLPQRLASADDLTVWAVEFRYEESLQGRFDRSAVIELVAAVREWVAAIVGP